MVALSEHVVAGGTGGDLVVVGGGGGRLGVKLAEAVGRRCENRWRPSCWGDVVLQPLNRCHREEKVSRVGRPLCR